MRQDPEATEPSSRTIAQPISMGESWRCQTRRLKLNEGYSLKSVTALDGARVIHFQKPARPRGDRKVGTYIEAGPYPSIQTLRRSVGRDAWHSIREGQATRSLCHFAMLWSFDQETAVCAYEPPLRPKSCTYPNSYELEKSSESGYLFIVYEFFKESPWRRHFISWPSAFPIGGAMPASTHGRLSKTLTSETTILVLHKRWLTRPRRKARPLITITSHATSALLDILREKKMPHTWQGIWGSQCIQSIGGRDGVKASMVRNML